MYDFLKGLRVVEGASFIAGPTCALYLAQMGAEVIRFDTIGGGPDFHRWPLAPGGASFYWEGLNKGKKSIAIDLGSSEGRELATAIICAPGDNAGFFVTNYPADGFLAYDRLKAKRADLICVRVMGWADGTPAVDYTINAAVGVPYMTGPTESTAAVNHVLPAWDLLTGAYAAFSLMTAERHRRATGMGFELRLPLSDVAAASLSHMGQVAEVLNTGADRPRYGNALYGAFGRDFLTADGARLMVVAISRRQWAGLVKALNLKEAVAQMEARLGVSFGDDESVRFRFRDHLFPLFETAFGMRRLAELAPVLDREHVTWSVYQTLREAVTTDDRLFGQNQIFETMQHPSGMTYPTAGPAGTIVGTPRKPVAHAPRLGEHTDEVLADILGLSAGEIGRLHDSGIVAGAS
ncbi:MAG: carnitine dehydratase [Rhodospirillaceae bacterium]|nr:MAG: carnitine dehydratase [Rhodospirillaceae bacterium]